MCNCFQGSRIEETVPLPEIPTQCPRGMLRLFSLSLKQVMSSGAIPVMVVRDWVPPFREQIDWPSFSFAFTPDQVGPEMVAILRSIPADVLKDMQVWKTTTSFVQCLVAGPCLWIMLRRPCQLKSLLFSKTEILFWLVQFLVSLTYLVSTLVWGQI